MKPSQLNRKINRLSEHLANPIDTKIKIDLDSFSEAEKVLFRRVDKVAEEYSQTGSVEFLAKNSDLITKNLEVFLTRISELYCCVVPKVLGCDESDEIVEYFFKLHFNNFEADLIECLMRVRTWSKKEREEFVLDLRKNGGIFFRIPRGFSEYNDVKSKEEKKEIE